MKIELTEAKTIKARDYDVGDVAIVTKELGERMIEEGVANRVIEEPENRMHPLRFSKHRKVFTGSDGKKYERQGETYIEIEE